MKRLVISCQVDPFFRPNNRVHHLFGSLSAYFEDVTVIYIRHVHNDTLWKKLRSFCTLSVERRRERGINFIGVDPPLRPGHQHRTLVDRTIPPTTHWLRHPLKSLLLELTAEFGFVLEWTYSWSLYFVWRKYDREPCDVVIGQSLSPYGFALMLKDRGFARVAVADDFDYLPGNYMNSTVRMALSRWRENELLKRFDIIVSVGDALAELRRHETGSIVHVIANGIHYEKLAVAQDKLPHPPTVIYVGTLIEWTGLDVSIRAFKRMLERVPQARMLIVGQGLAEYIEHIHNLIRQLQLQPCVDFLGEVANQQLPEILRKADVGLAMFQPIALRKYAFSMKVVEYLGAGIVPIVTEGIESGDFVESRQCGHAVAYTEEAIAQAMGDLLLQPEQRAHCVANGTKVAETLDWQPLMRRYAELLAALNHAALGSTDVPNGNSR